MENWIILVNSTVKCQDICQGTESTVQYSSCKCLGTGIATQGVRPDTEDNGSQTFATYR